ncbi:MAG: class II glutamine amidotransferase [Pseudomonadota bacterium]
MRRLLAVLATDDTELSCALVDAPHSLMVQSREDLEGFAHADGRGIVRWEDHDLRVRRHLGPAHEGEDFLACARGLRARRLIAHVRQATEGDVRI